MTPAELAAVATVLELLEKHPPKDESWDRAERDGPGLEKRLRAWLKEQL